MTSTVGQSSASWSVNSFGIILIALQNKFVLPGVIMIIQPLMLHCIPIFSQLTICFRSCPLGQDKPVFGFNALQHILNNLYHLSHPKK